MGLPHFDQIREILESRAQMQNQTPVEYAIIRTDSAERSEVSTTLSEPTDYEYEILSL
jgi:hypothetical protein